MPQDNNGPGTAEFDRLMRELRGAGQPAPLDQGSGQREVEVTVRVELSDEAAKFIQVAGVSVDELGV